MDIIFIIGLFLMPFENLIIAPSSGWATLTPIIFFLYVVVNLKEAFKSIYKFKIIFIFIIGAILISLINYIFVGIEFINFINALISLVLGVTNLLSFDIFFRKNNYKINKYIKFLLIAYSISLIVGWIQFCAIKFDINFIKEFFMAIEKRSYITNNRVQFTFTEPSFIGMHLFGVLLLMYIYTKDKRIPILILLFAISSIIFSCGIRILLDIMICSILFLILNSSGKTRIISLSCIILVASIGLPILYNNNYRVKIIIDKGVYADGSFASRYFRINSSVKGYIKDNRLLIGYGLGNSLIPIRSGYQEAMEEYKSTYLKEMNELADENYTNDSVSYCLYTRIISEFGLVYLIAFIGYLYHISRKVQNKFLRNYIFILLYLYVQFESYAFYTIWLYIVMANIDMQRIKNKE